METKRITTAFQEKALANSEEELCRGYMDCIDKLFEDCDSALEELGLGKCGYVSQVERNNEMIEDMIKLKLYVWSAHMEVYEKLDKPLFIAFKNGATQALSEIVLDDFETDNTIGMEKHNKVTGYLYSGVTTEVKKTLKISDFLGIVEVEPEDGYPVLENIETIGEFALLFREDYANMKSSTDINKKLQAFLEYGEYRHRMYHPEDDYLSGALDIIPLKPLMESFTGVDCITEEELTEFERMLKFSEAVVDIFTWGQAAVAFKAGGYVGKDLAKAIGASIFTDIFAGTTAYTVGYCSNMGGASPIASTVLSMMAGCSVSALNGRVFLDIDSSAFKGGSNTIITPEMEEKILFGQRKNPAKNELIGGHSPDINNSNPNYAVEVLQVNPDGTQKVKFVTQYADGNLSNIKTSTLFPEGWSSDKIINSIKTVGDSLPIGVRTSDGAMLYRDIIDGVQIEVIKIGDTVTSGYPTGGIKTGLLPGFSTLE